MDQYHVVAQVYQNLFGHAPDLPGLTFWGQALINGSMTINNVVTQIALGAQGTDLAAYNNKVAAATSFTAALTTPAQVLAYSGDAANAVAKAYIAGVTDTASLTAAIDPAALATAISNVVNSAPGTAGQTFVLGLGMDQLAGTTGNDTFQVYDINPSTGVAANNFQAFDTIDGGAGKDTLNIQTDGTNNTTFGTTSNIETINITNTGAAAVAVDGSHFAGATAINQAGLFGGVTGLAAGTTAGFTGSGLAANTAITVGAAGASAAVSLNNVQDSTTLAVSGSSLNSVTVSGTRVNLAGGSVAALALGVTAGKDVQSVSINTNQKTTLTVAANGASTKAITTVDASASTGSVTYTTADANVANIKSGAGNDTVTLITATNGGSSTVAAVNASVSTGAGNDTININATADATNGGGVVTVDAGAGNDTINATKVATVGLHIAGGDGNDTVVLTGATLATTDVIDGGAGSNTISLGGAASRVAGDYIMFNKELANFSTIKFSSVEGALDASQLAANYTTVDLFAGSAVTGVGSQALVAHGALNATAAGYIAGDTYAGNLNITESTNAATVTAQSDVLTLAVKAVAANNVGTTVAGDIQSAVVSVTNTVDSTSNPTTDRVASVSIDSASLAGLKSVTLTGNGSATVNNAVGSHLTTVDASALGGTLLSGAATTGLTYTSANASVETIKLGSGVDNVTLSASTYGTTANHQIDTVVGLHLVAKSDMSALAAGSDVLNVTGVATTVVAMTTTQTDLDLALTDAVHKGADVVFTMGGDTYIFHDAGTPGAIDSADIVVKLAGVTDVNAVIVSLGGHP
jgi:hypothetical protein